MIDRIPLIESGCFCAACVAFWTVTLIGYVGYLLHLWRFGL